MTCGSCLRSNEDCVCGYADRQLARFDVVLRESMKTIPRYFIPMPDGITPYLERLILEDNADSNGKTISKTYLHVIYASDGDRDPHDHPFDFSSQIIFGEYEETSFVRACKKCEVNWRGDTMACINCGGPLSAGQGCSGIYQAGMTNTKKAHELHKLTLKKGSVVTLVTRGPKIREWGFQTPEGWINHKPYIAEKFPGAQPTEVD